MTSPHNDLSERISQSHVALKWSFHHQVPLGHSDKIVPLVCGQFINIISPSRIQKLRLKFYNCCQKKYIKVVSVIKSLAKYITK